MRGVEVFLNTLAPASLLANIEGLKSVGCDNHAAVTVQSNPDGSVDIYFGPKAPGGKESNWVQTSPGKGWFTILRL